MTCVCVVQHSGSRDWQAHTVWLRNLTGLACQLPLEICMHVLVLAIVRPYHVCRASGLQAAGGKGVQ